MWTSHLEVNFPVDEINNVGILVDLSSHNIDSSWDKRLEFCEVCIQVRVECFDKTSITHIQHFTNFSHNFFALVFVNVFIHDFMESKDFIHLPVCGSFGMQTHSTCRHLMTNLSSD